MQKRYRKELFKCLAEIKDPRIMESFLQALLTPKELEELPMRLQIVKQLKAGVSQREIAETLGVGIATVTRGAREIKDGNFQDV